MEVVLNVLNFDAHWRVRAYDPALEMCRIHITLKIEYHTRSAQLKVY